MTPNKERDFDEEVAEVCATSAKILRVSKVIVLGDLEVGKTSLVRRFCHKHWERNYKPTIGVDFELERFDILGVPFNLQIWDTAGQERFKAIAASYYRNASVIMVVFDLGSLTSLSHCQQWLNEARKCNNGPHFVFLVGTKKDTISSTSYYNVEKRADDVAKQMNAEYWAVSAKTDDGVKELFTRVAALSFNVNMRGELRSEYYENLKIGTEAISKNFNTIYYLCQF